MNADAAKYVLARLCNNSDSTAILGNHDLLTDSAQLKCTAVSYM